MIGSKKEMKWSRMWTGSSMKPAMASNEKVTRVLQEGSLLFSSFGSFVINP